MTAPFIIYALPRSRTAWLSAFLTYKDWECYHEAAMFMRSMDDVRRFFTSDNIGCAETAAMHGRPLIKNISPIIKEVVILRPLDEVIDSLMKIDLSGVAHYERCILEKGLGYCDRVLREIAKDKNVLVFSFEDLHREDVCAEIFEHCLPYKFDEAWYEYLKNKNIQINSKAFMRYRLSHRSQISEFKRLAKLELFKLCRTGVIRKAA